MKKSLQILLSFLFVFTVTASFLWAEENMTKEAAEKAVSGVEKTVSDTVDKTADKNAAGAEETVSDAVDKVVDKAAEMATEVKEAVTEIAPTDVLAQAEELVEEGGLENCKQALDISMKAVKNEPGSYKANWVCAMACREYSDVQMKLNMKGWKKICKDYGKKGMQYAEEAIKIEPKKVEGHYWYGMSVGKYSDGVSILTALKEGLKDKTQTSFETAYKINKKYDKGGPIGALGRFWQVLPWPLSDSEKSIEYYREFQKTKFYKDPETVEIRIYLAEHLMDEWGSKPKKEAKTLLKQAIKMTKDDYWKKEAKKLLDDL